VAAHGLVAGAVRKNALCAQARNPRRDAGTPPSAKPKMTHRPGHPQRRRAALLAALLAAALLTPRPADGELVVLTDGRFLKASGYEVVGHRVRVELVGGGTLTLSLSRVERVVDDEVLPEPEPPVVEAPAPGVAWEFDPQAPPPASPYGNLIQAAAERHGVNAALVAALVRAESAFDPYALSHKGARGLMQLMPATAQRFGVLEHQMFEPERNLEAGTRYLRWLLDRYDGDVVRALAAYNAGEGTVDRYGGVPPFRETRDYIRRIYASLGVPEAVLGGVLEGSGSAAAASGSSSTLLR